MDQAESIEPADPQPINPSCVAADNILDIQKSGHLRIGKIANLPKEQRDELNQMLTDGAMPHRRGGSFQTFPVPFPQGDIKVNKGKSR